MAERTLTKPSLQTLRVAIRKKLHWRHQGPIIGLEIDGPTLRIVEVGARSNGSQITRLACEPLGLANEADRSDPSAVGRATAAILERLQIKPGAVVMGVPRAMVVLRTLTIPESRDVREMASMVRFQVAKDLPIRADDAVIDFRVRRPLGPPAATDSNGKGSPAPSDSKGDFVGAPAKVEVLVAAVRRDVVDFFQQTTAAAGVRLLALGWLSDANACCLKACRVAMGSEPVALVTLRPDEVAIDVVAEDCLLFSRGASTKQKSESPQAIAPSPEPAAPAPPESLSSAPDAAPPDPFVEAAIIEVVRSLHSYGAIEPKSPVTQLLVAGCSGHELAVVEALKNRLNIPCQTFEPAVALELPAAAPETVAGSISALGLALAYGGRQGLSFDFLNPKRPAVPRNTRRIGILAAAAAITALLVVVFGIRTRWINQRLQIHRQLLAELSDAEKKRPIYRQMRQQAAAVQDWIKVGQDSLEHYTYLSAVLPKSEEVYVTSLAMSGQGTIRLAVQARSGEILAKLDKQLRAAGYEVKPLAITPAADKFGYDFRSTVELTAPENMKIDLAKVRPPPRPADDASIDSLNKTRKGLAP